MREKKRKGREGENKGKRKRKRKGKRGDRIHSSLGKHKRHVA